MPRGAGWRELHAKYPDSPARPARRSSSCTPSDTAWLAEVGRRVPAALQRDARQHERQVEPRGTDARVRPVDDPDPVLVVGVDHDVVGAQVPVHEGVARAHAQRLLLPADQLLDVVQRPPADVAGEIRVLLLGLAVEGVQLAPAGEVLGQLVVRARQRVPGQGLGVCERSHGVGDGAQVLGPPRAARESGRAPPRSRGSPSRRRRRTTGAAGAGTCGGSAWDTRISARARSGETRVLLAGDGLDEDAAPVGELEHGGETGAEPAGRADLGRDLSARQLGDPGPDVPREVAPVQPLAAEGEREGNDVIGTHAAHPAS